MNLNNQATKRANMIVSLFWSAIALVLAIIHISLNNLSEGFIIKVLLVFIVVFLINIFRLTSMMKSGSYFDQISWSIFQSALLILAAFSTKFMPEDRRVFWLGLGAVSLLYATTRLSSAWLSKRFKNIDDIDS